MKNSRRTLSSLLAVAGIAMAGSAAMHGDSTPTKRRRSAEPPRYPTLTAEQRAWNEAVDKRRAEKKARKGGAR